MMTLEEAGEIVLQGTPWTACGLCSSRGRIRIFGLDEHKSKKCQCCDGNGYYLGTRARWAYEMTGSTLPPKPLTGVEKVAQMAGQCIKSMLGRPSRMWITPQLLNDLIAYPRRTNGV